MLSALRLPISCGSILVALTTGEEDTRDWVCEILRDLIGISIATTSTWAIITIMFRSDLQYRALKKVLEGKEHMEFEVKQHPRHLHKQKQDLVC